MDFDEELWTEYCNKIDELTEKQNGIDGINNAISILCQIKDTRTDIPARMALSYAISSLIRKGNAHGR